MEKSNLPQYLFYGLGGVGKLSYEEYEELIRIFFPNCLKKYNKIEDCISFGDILVCSYPEIPGQYFLCVKNPEEWCAGFYLRRERHYLVQLGNFSEPEEVIRQTEINLLKQRCEAYDKMISYVTEYPGGVRSESVKNNIKKLINKLDVFFSKEIVNNWKDYNHWFNRLKKMVK